MPFCQEVEEADRSARTENALVSKCRGRMGKSSRRFVIGAIITGTVVIAAVWWIIGGHRGVIDDVLDGYRKGAAYGRLVIEYPLDETVFPPEIVPPRFRWNDDSCGCDEWVITLRFSDGGDPLRFTVKERSWVPSARSWTVIKKRSTERRVEATVLGFGRAAPEIVLSEGRVRFTTSKDEVGAPIFYREVNLPFEEAVKDPTEICWRFGSISSPQAPPIVLEGLPVCGNCHSFSADGRVLGMDVDYANDKGSYAFTQVSEEMTLADDNILTWSDYRREDGELTFGLLSQVSPDGRYAVSTVKDRSVFVPRPELAFSQLFFPIKGILAVYSKETGEIVALPGADDPTFVQSNPTWSPDGKHIVFARSVAHQLKLDRGNVLLTREQCAEFLDREKTVLFDLYRIPFNEGRGGAPEPLEGASHNGMSNYFARYSPDGKWIVFCRSSSFMLLQPDSELYIIPARGGAARRMRCNTPRMNSWHSWSPNSRWLVFSSKANSPYTQLFLTHIDEEGYSSPAVVLSQFTSSDRAANIPEFVNTTPEAIRHIREQFLDDVSYVRAGDAFRRAGDVDGAMAEYRKALRLNANSAVAHDSLGALLVLTGKPADGESHLSEALRLDPDSASAHYNLGMLRLRQRRADDAINHLAHAVRRKPELADAHCTLGSLLCGRGMIEKGSLHLSEAIRFDPENAVAHQRLGSVLFSQGRSDEAISHMATAARLEPEDAGVWLSLGRAEYGAGRYRDAIAHMTKAVLVKPNDATSLREAAWILATVPDETLRDGPRAVGFALQACELTGHRSMEALDVLGVCHAAAGQFEEAVRAARQALELAQAAGQMAVAEKILARIELYKQGEAYRPGGEK